MDPVDFFCITFLLRRFTELSQNMFPAEISVTWTQKKKICPQNMVMLL